MSDTSIVTIEEVNTSLAPDTLIVRLNRLNKRNALSADLKRKLTATARQLAERTDIGAVILTGSGGSFCAGNDIM